MGLRTDVVLVTTTFVQQAEDVRAKLAIRTCVTAAQQGYRIIVVDGNPSKGFKDTLRATGAEVLDQVHPGMGNSRRECLAAGLRTDAEAIVWLEPEKHPLVPLLWPCIEPVLRLECGVVIPRRRSLDGYPQYQQWSEYAANWALGNLTGRYDLDFYIGPRILSRACAAMMQSYDGKKGDNWEILFLPLVWMMKKQVRIKSVMVDYIHPPEQLIEDDKTMRDKRDKQRNDLITAMTAEAQEIGL